MTEKESAHPSSRQLSELTLNNLLSPDSEIVPGQPKSLETLLENKVICSFFFQTAAIYNFHKNILS